MTPRRRFIAIAIVQSLSAIAEIAACGGAARPPTPIVPQAPVTAAPVAKPAEPQPPDPDLQPRPPPRKLLDIDWAKVDLTTDAAALAVWQRISATAGEWYDRLEEIPSAARRPLAIAMLHGGNFLCTPPAQGDCPEPLFEVAAPREGAGIDDPCQRRLLAIWAIDKLEPADLPKVRDALLAIAALPPPESELTAAAIRLIPEDDQDARLAILGIAWRADQRELVAGQLGGLDEQHLITAVRVHHIDAALEILSAEGHRAVYLAAVTDTALGTRARIGAIGDLVAAAGEKLPPDLIAALVTAAKSRDCGVAAAAARALDTRGDHRFVPKRPRTTSPAVMIQALCTLASYELMSGNDAPSLVPSYVPARGLDRRTISYDALSDTDPDGDGDPHTAHTVELVARDEAVLPEIEDMVRAMQHCTGAICVSYDREFRFVLRRVGGELWLAGIEIIERPPCPLGTGNSFIIPKP